MRLFCLNFHKENWNPDNLEAFLKFTPLLAYRLKKEFSNQHLIWGDVSKTFHFFPNEESFFQAVKKKCEVLKITSFSICLGQTTWETELFSEHFQVFVSEPGRERQSLRPFPVSSLKDFAGLTPWDRPAEISRLVDFLENLGVNYFSDLDGISETDWHVRFGKTGHLIWQKLHRASAESLTVLAPKEALKAYRYLETSLDSVGQLLWVVGEELASLFLRLESRHQMVHRLTIELRFEYSKEKKFFEWSPTYRGRDLSFYQKLIEEKLEKVELLNPVQEIEIEIFPTRSQVKQFDLFEPQTSDLEKTLQLQSFLAEHQIASGFLQFQNKILPEEMLTLETEARPTLFEQTSFETEVSGARRELPVYSEQVALSPRPNLLLSEPHPLSEAELNAIQILKHLPMEKMSVGLTDPMTRTYAIAKDRHENVLWIYRDGNSGRHYLHGFFD